MHIGLLAAYYNKGWHSPHVLQFVFIYLASPQYFSCSPCSPYLHTTKRFSLELLQIRAENVFLTNFQKPTETHRLTILRNLEAVA